VGAVSAVNTALVLVGGCALVTAAIKVAGPVALGGRVMPAAFTAIVLLLAPALLAALVVTQALADGGRLAVARTRQAWSREGWSLCVADLWLPR